MKKKIFIFLIILILLNSNCLFLEVRKKVFGSRKTSSFPVVGNDIKIKIKNADRYVNGLYSKKGKKLIVLLHGNANVVDSEVVAAKKYYSNGYSTLLIEYPGSGLSYKYKMSENNIYSDSEKMVRYMMKKYKYKKSDIYIHGRSLGAAVGVELAKRNLCAKLIIVSPFTSIPEMAASKNYSKALANLVVLDKFNNKLKAPFIRCPVLIIHGKSDSYTPYQMSIILNKKIRNSELILIKNANHSNIYKFFSEKIWGRIFDFVE